MYISYSSLEEPVLSVIIPTYELHHKYLQEAVNSVDFPGAEVIIVNDSLEHLEVSGDNIHIINRDDPDPWGTGKARNVGARLANTDLFFWLDSDDRFLPNGINIVYNAYVKSVTDEHPYGLITYGGLLRGFDNDYWPMQDQYCGPDIKKSGLMTPAMPYCILIPRMMHDLIGGYDESLETWEDVDYEKLITVNGLCTQRVNGAIFWYRWDSGTRRKLSGDPDVHKRVSDIMLNKYIKYHTGESKLGNCQTCGNQPVSPYKQPAQKVNALPTTVASNEELYLVYIGTEGVHTEVGPVTKTPYRVGQSQRESQRRKLVVNKTANLEPHEISRSDAEELITIRKGGFNQYRWETKVIVPGAPIPLRPKTQAAPPQPTSSVKNDIDFIFEGGDLIEDYSISKMKDHLAQNEVFKAQLQRWLEQEENRQQKYGSPPRSGMIKVLNDALANS